MDIISIWNIEPPGTDEKAISMVELSSPNNHTKIQILAISILLLITRTIYLLSPAGRVGDADEAVFGMMAQEIEALKGFPIYCWGAHYAGAAVSYIAAIIFHYLGSAFSQLRLAMLPAALLTPILFYFIYWRLFPANYAFVGSLFLIFCPFLVLRYTMAALGGYGETCLGIGMIILLSWKILNQNTKETNRRWSFVLGLTCGFFFYILFLVLPTILSFAIPSIWRDSKDRVARAAIFCFGFLLGSLPLLFYNAMHHGATLLRAAGRSFSIGREALEMPMTVLFQQLISDKIQYLKDWLTNSPSMFGNFMMPEIFGYEIMTVSGFLLLMSLVFFSFTAYSLSGSRKFRFYLRPFSTNIVFLIVFHWIVNLDRPRHLLPLFYFIPIVFFALGERYGSSGRRTFALVLSLCFFQTIGWKTQMEKCFFDPKPAIAIMRSNGIGFFYGSYWTTYPIIFESKATIIGSPMLLGRDEVLSDRRPEFTQQVRGFPNPAFLFAPGEVDLQNRFLKFLKGNWINAQNVEVEGASLYFNLSRSVDAFVSSNGRTHFISRDFWKNDKNKDFT